MDRQVESVGEARGVAGPVVKASGVAVAGGDVARVAEEDGRAIVEMLRIAAPTVATMASYTAMQFVDGLMASRIEPASPVYLAAQGNGGIAAWLVISVLLGTLMVVNTYVSQHLGAGKPEKGAGYGWAALWLSLGFWVLAQPYALALPWLYGAMGHEGELLRLETRYAQILVAGAVFTTGARGIAQYFFGMHRPMVVLWAVLAGNTVNVALNLLLIFGAEGLGATGWVAIDAVAGATAWMAGVLGVPAMGLSGAAVATVIGSAVELAVPLAIFLGPRFNERYATRSAWRPALGPIRDIVRIGWPGALMMASEIVCWSYLMVFLLGAAGVRAGESAEVHNAAGWIALRYMHLSFMPTVGLSIAVTAMVGRCMGMGRADLAARRAWLGLGISTAYMGVCGLAFVVFRRELIGLFAPETMEAAAVARLIEVGAGVMIAAAVFQVFDAIAITLSGALRGAGDTVWPGVATVALSWACIVGGGWGLMALAPGLGSLGPWIAAASYIVLLGVYLFWRFAAGSWRTIRLVPAAGATGAAGV